jgi:uncharacterized protein (DUF362 family)/Pyruvate/2-oxoacid:ferredoxin oxidoreductase delta subunit
MTDVALVSCDSYEREKVQEAVKSAIDLIGGLGAYLSSGQTVLVKPNILQGASPERCVTTHPEVIRAVAVLLQDHGCRVIIADSPGSGIIYNEKNLRKAYAACGLDRMADELGITLNVNTGSQYVPFPGGRIMKRFPILTPAIEADAIVVVSKAKTHMWTYMTGAAKNLFGLIPGLEKPAFHARFQDNETFGAMIVDLNELMKPRLQIMDAVVGMEGNGPMNGTPRHIGALLASGDSTALDVVLARILSLDPHRIPTIAAAIDRGLVEGDLSDVRVVGEPINSIVVGDYQPPGSYAGARGTFPSSLLLRLTRTFGKSFSLRPIGVTDECVVCGQCARSCPAGAITMKKDGPQFDVSSCIRCYCCHEMCPYNAIVLERSALGRLVWKITGE